MDKWIIGLLSLFASPLIVLLIGMQLENTSIMISASIPLVIAATVFVWLLQSGKKEPTTSDIAGGPED